jgi:SNF2 family DNA or RNA helicase
MGYEMMKLTKNDIAKHNFSALVLDEAQHVKNNLSENFEGAAKISATHRLYLTGMQSFFFGSRNRLGAKL